MDSDRSLDTKKLSLRKRGSINLNGVGQNVKNLRERERERE